MECECAAVLYTPYFFDKNFLDSILEDSADQHFDALIQSRRVQRRGDVVDDSFAAEIIEESADSIWEPGEVQDMMDEIGESGIPLSVLSKAAELQLSYAVDKVLLGNRWLRKATGIQPKFSYMVDSFERRNGMLAYKRGKELKERERVAFVPALSAISQSRAQKIATCYDTEGQNELPEQSELKSESEQGILLQQADHQSPSRDWPSPPWSKPYCKPKIEADSRAIDSSGGSKKQEVEDNPLLPRITLFGVPANDLGRMTKTNVKKTMEEVNKQMDEEISKELEQQAHVNSVSKNSGKYCHEDRDPFFVATFGDYFSNMGGTRSPRRRRGIRR
ncbi:EF-hand calcium-binding domain-containing protein 12 [Bienertia sinuspersici]